MRPAEGRRSKLLIQWLHWLAVQSLPNSTTIGEPSAKLDKLQLAQNNDAESYAVVETTQNRWTAVTPLVACETASRVQGGSADSQGSSHVDTGLPQQPAADPDTEVILSRYATGQRLTSPGKPLSLSRLHPLAACWRPNVRVCHNL